MKHYNFKNINNELLDDLENKFLSQKTIKREKRPMRARQRFIKSLKNPLRSKKTITFTTKEEIRKFFDL